MDFDKLVEELDERAQRRHEYQLMEFRVESAELKAEIKDCMDAKLDKLEQNTIAPLRRRIRVLENWRTTLVGAWAGLLAFFHFRGH